MALQVSTILRIVCFTKPVLHPEINDKVLNHIILFKSGGKPWESVLLKATMLVSVFCFFFPWKDRI